MQQDKKESHCCLRGESIDLTLPNDDPLSLTSEHVPPKQFFPKKIRVALNPKLETVPSHKLCNEDSRKDEEYFYHSIAIHVVGTHPVMGPAILEDLKRRTHKPQTPAMVRKILANSGTTTKGGIILPRNLVEVAIDEYRLEQVALKIAQCIYHLETGEYSPKTNCRDIRLCRSQDEIPEFYDLSFRVSGFKGSYPQVFKYAFLDWPDDNEVIISALLWESMMLCMVFKKPEHQSNEPLTLDDF